MSTVSPIAPTATRPASAASNVISALPFLQRDAESIWTRAMVVRDTFYALIEATYRELGIEALVRKSPDFHYPAWVSLEAWLPAAAPDATHRVFCTFSIQPKPYAQFEFEITVACTRNGKEKKYGPCRPPPEFDVVPWARYLLDRGPLPGVARLRNPLMGWQFWLPKNEVPRLGRDTLGIVGKAALVAGVIFLAIPFVAFLLIVGGVACLLVRRFRRKVVVNGGRPIAEPRTLRLVDNWQTVANGLGQQWQDVRDRLFRRLSEGVVFKIQSRLEDISYLTPDGIQERKQFVLTQGRGIVFCHVYPYGDDLYVGWDAHLNYGQWAEQAVAFGFDRTLGLPAVINTVVPGTIRANEYDLIDLNSLTEWAHARIVQVLKQVMAERKLDQEIDFKIVRGERQSLLHEEKPRTAKRLFSRAGGGEG
jgi:hypothetical protein